MLEFSTEGGSIIMDDMLHGAPAAYDVFEDECSKGFGAVVLKCAILRIARE